MRKLELIIAFIMLTCTVVSLVTLFFCKEELDMMMTTVAFIFSAAIGVLALSAGLAAKY